MVDKIYSKDHSENVRIFQDIDHKKKYSNYSLELNRAFGDKSYDIFYKNLIEHRRARGGDFKSLFQKPKNMKGMRIYEEPFNAEAFKVALNQMKLKTDKLDYKLKNPYKSRPTIPSITKEKTQNLLDHIKKRKLGIKDKDQNSDIENDDIYIPEVPDVGRYNPSFDIVRKHTFQVSFCNSNYHDFNKSGKKIIGRNLFEGLNNTDYAYNLTDLKQMYINTTPVKDLSKMSKTVKNNSNFSVSQSKTNRKKHLYLCTSPFYNSRIIHKEKIKNKRQNKNNLSIINNESQILIRNNGDANSRCHKHDYNLNTSNTSLSFDDSKINNSGILNTSNNSKNNNKSKVAVDLKKNHCLKFDNYSERKPMVNPLNYTTEHFSNPEAFNNNYPIRNKNACIEFNKLSTSKEKQKCYFEVEANKNKNPPLGLYFPKFEKTFNKLTADIYIDKKEIPMTNKRKLKKIMYRYQVPTNYLLFNSLNDK